MSEEPKNPSWGPMGGGPARQPQFVRDQAANMIKLRTLLEGMVQQKQAEILAHQEKLLRLLHGGGK